MPHLNWRLTAFQLESLPYVEPENIDLRKVLTLHLLNSGRRQEAVDHFYFLQERNIAEGAYFLGVVSEEAGEQEKARGWFQRALQLNPGHHGTLQKMSPTGIP